MSEWLKLTGLLIKAGDVHYRIYYVANGNCFLCNADSNKLELVCYDEELLRHQISVKEIEVVEEKPKVVPTEKLTGSQREKYERKLSFIHEVEDEYGPTFMDLMGKAPKKKLNELKEKYDISSSQTVWRLIRLYIQSGCKDTSLVNKNAFDKKKSGQYMQTKKMGRPNKDGIELGKPLDEADIKAMEYGVEVYTKNKYATMEDAWDAMLDAFYSVPSLTGESTLLPPNKFPTLRQFMYFLDKTLTKQEKNEIKQGKVEYRNNERLLSGSSQSYVEYPGQVVEVDATEIDSSLRSEDLDKTVGRPIVYFMVDVFSRAIIACSVSFENNSDMGFANLMINLADDKVEYAARYKAASDYTKSWPSGIIPEQMRVDRGSEYRSIQYKEICKRLNIEANLLPARTGSLKGIVEGKFHEFQQTWRHKLKDKGLITKDYNSDHHRQAVLKLEEFTQLTIAFVIAYNNKHMTDYPLQKELIDAGVEIMSPVNVWEYGCRQRGEPRWITAADHDQFLYDILKETNASISREGIRIDGLVYTSNDPYIISSMVKAGKKTVKFPVRRDPRDVSVVYYVHEGKIKKAVLNTRIPGQEAYLGMTLFEYKQQYEIEKAARRKGERHNQGLRYNLNKAYDGIVQNAKNESKPDSNNMTESRRSEKNRVNYENRVETHMTGFGTLPDPVRKEPKQLPEPMEEPISFEGMTQDEMIAYTSDEARKFRRSMFTIEEFDDDEEEEK